MMKMRAPSGEGRVSFYILDFSRRGRLRRPALAVKPDLIRIFIPSVPQEVSGANGRSLFKRIFPPVGRDVGNHVAHGAAVWMQAVRQRTVIRGMSLIAADGQGYVWVRLWWDLVGYDSVRRMTQMSTNVPRSFFCGERELLDLIH
jgi:hypothetical protein